MLICCPIDCKMKISIALITCTLNVKLQQLVILD